MTTATEITETVQDGIMKVVETSQRLTLEALSAVVSTVDGIIPERPTMPFANTLVTPKQALDTTLRFADKLMASQKAFLAEIVTIAEPNSTVATPAKKTA
jgi:hypothetical protein